DVVGQAVASIDYTIGASTLNFAGNNGETQSITVNLTTDSIVELDETFEVNLSNVQAGGRNVAITVSQGIGTIQNDDSATLSIDDVIASEADTGTNPIFTFTVTLDAEVDIAFTVDFATADGTAAIVDNDYTATSGSGGTALNFVGTVGETQTIGVTIIGDDTVELNENFFVDLSNIQASGRDVNFADNQGQGTIQNDDAATLAINSAGGSEDAGPLTFTVTLTGDVDAAFNVDYATADVVGQAVASIDYTIGASTLNFAGNNGETQSITINLTTDSIVELDETFEVNLSNVQAGGRNVTIAINQGIGTIQNDDSATLSIDDVIASEADTGTNPIFTFTVTLDAEVNIAFTVDFATADGTAAIVDNDYTATSGSGGTALNFVGTAGETQTIEVTVIGDDTVELNENFFVDLNNIQASGRDVSFGDSQGQGNITNDDAATLSINDLSLAEGDAGTTAFNFTVTLDLAIDTGVSVDYATADNTATIADNDYNAINVTTLNFTGNAGETRTITVNVNGDTTNELNEIFDVNLNNIQPNGRSVTISNNLGQGTIINDDQALFTIDDIVLAEGNTGTTTFVFTVTRDDNALANTIDYQTADNTAITGIDYTAAGPGILNFPAGGVLTQTVIVQASGDNMVELNETFYVNLSNATGEATIADNQGLGTITNDDAATLVINDVSLAEGDAGLTAFNFSVTLDFAVDAGISVDYATADNTATIADNDYNAITATLNFAGNAGETQTFTVNVNGDANIESNEIFDVNLINLQPNGRNVTIGDALGQGTINNDDWPSFTIDNVTLAEGNSGTVNFIFTVTRDDNTYTNTVDYQTADNTAATGVDYTALGPETLNFPAGGTLTQTVTVQVSGDNIVELNETFYVDLSNATGGAAIADNQGLGTITNDDAAALVINDVSLAEGDAGTTVFSFSVTLDNAVDTGLSVDYTVADNTATTVDNDYNPIPAGTLNFVGTAAEIQTVTVQVNGDTTVELNESFFVNLGNLQPNSRNVSIGDAQGQGDIINDDAAALVIDDVSLVEGDVGLTAFNFAVTLDFAVDTGISVDYATADNTATIADNDYNAIATTTLNFVGDTGETQNFTINVNGDMNSELNEIFDLNLFNLQASGRNVIIGDNLGQGTIVNDDGATFTVDDVALNEGHIGTTNFVFTVTRTTNTFANTVDCHTTDNTAMAGTDYTAVGPVTLNFPFGGTLIQTITVQVSGDISLESDETFYVNLSNATGSATIADNQGLATIINDDARIGDLVWYDADADGIQDTGEQVISGITIELYDSSNILQNSTITNAGGIFDLDVAAATNYYLRFITSTVYTITQQNQGSDDTVDSDADPMTGETPIFNLAVGITNNDLDCGMIQMDFGDAPETAANYPTTLINNGARHIINGMTAVNYLGATVDGESDGQPSANLDGDDNNGTPFPGDEDGVTIPAILIPGSLIDVIVLASVGGGFLNAWIDFNRDGDWMDGGERIFTDESLGSGTNNLTFIPPVSAISGATAARFRFTSYNTGGLLSYDGLADDGEVEDYLTTIADLDFGDAPAPYPTTLPEGARHVVGALFLGAAIDDEADGQPTANLDGDDNDTGGDDEDGVSISTLIQGQDGIASIVVSGGSALLNAWIDFNKDGDWLDNGEQIFIDRVVVTGPNTLIFNVPATAIAENTAARFRLDSSGGLTPAYLATDGEVEDYQVTIHSDIDGDGDPDSSDPDDDNDGIADIDEDLNGTDPLNPHECGNTETNHDGSIIGDGCDDCTVGVDGFGPQSDVRSAVDGTDSDGDGWCNSGDNCVRLYNPGQENADGDAFGDVCERDDDNDSVLD
ncbi:MAG: hypothetical protein GY869_22985, partial [Planctomycetes bacterium]|nr:hypothetical protein [Planctomycetota bacterium]